MPEDILPEQVPLLRLFLVLYVKSEIGSDISRQELGFGGAQAWRWVA